MTRPATRSLRSFFKTLFGVSFRVVYQLVLCALRGLALREFFTHPTTLAKLYME